MRKIGELKGKPIIEGNPNEIKKNQIHYKESDGGITLSERKEDNTLSSVTSGSGSGEGGGVKEYYYKILGGYSSNEQNMIESLYVLRSAICKLQVYNKPGPLQYGYNYVKASPSIIALNNEKIAIHLIDTVDYAWTYNDYNNSYNAQIIPKGNIVDKIKYLAQEQGKPQEELQAMIDLINSMFQEITKEEYESMITYKPE